MTASQADRLLTAEELLEMPDDGSFYELVAGRLTRMSPSAWLPGVVASNMNFEMVGHVRANKLGICGTADSGALLRRNPDTVRAPDVWFVRAERVPRQMKDEFFPGSPDLAVEVLSPSDRFSDVVQKARDYLAAGSLLVWVLDPQGRSSAAFYPDGTARLLGEDDPLDGGDVLPGFSVTLRQLMP
jgi:Uma2 family endonuclease